tara:strand:+ start:377 stop:796 length:420 start_codon:yes stop_codon:yes gene_type:complete
MSIFEKYDVGLHNVGSYQVSGRPFVTSSAIPASGAQPNYWKVEFPMVTKEITIANNSNQTNKDIRIAFSENGLNDTVRNYFLKHPAKDGVGPTTFNVKATEIYIMSDDSHEPEVSVYAALTSIPTARIPDNWSGEDGVG